MLDKIDKEILYELQDNFPLVSRPYLYIAKKLKISEEEIIRRIKRMKKEGIIRRICASLRHRELGYLHNPLVCLKVKEEKADKIGEALAQIEEITHCYKRKIVPGKWEYNIYFVIHCKDRGECDRKLKEILNKIEFESYKVMYSTKEYKKTYKRIAK